MFFNSCLQFITDSLLVGISIFTSLQKTVITCEEITIPNYFYWIIIGLFYFPYIVANFIISYNYQHNKLLQYSFYARIMLWISCLLILCADTTLVECQDFQNIVSVFFGILLLTLLSLFGLIYFYV